MKFGKDIEDVLGHLSHKSLLILLDKIKYEEICDLTNSLDNINKTITFNNEIKDIVPENNITYLVQFFSNYIKTFNKHLIECPHDTAYKIEDYHTGDVSYYCIVCEKEINHNDVLGMHIANYNHYSRIFVFEKLYPIVKQYIYSKIKGSDGFPTSYNK